MDQTVQQVLTPFQRIVAVAIDFLVDYSFQVIGAILILILGAVIGRWIEQIVTGICQRRKLDVTLGKFLGNSARGLVLVFAVVIAIGKFGITIAPFIAAIGATAFGLTYAIQGPLSNYGAGLAIILGRPFVVGDTVTVAGVTGLVEEVRLACTILTDEDGVLITIPNKHIVGEIVHNSKANKIVESVVGISYDSDPERAIAAVREALAALPEVASHPPPQVGIQDFGASSLTLGLRYWVPTMRYFQASYAANLAVYGALKKASITIPYPQHDVHIVSPPNSSHS